MRVGDYVIFSYLSTDTGKEQKGLAKVTSVNPIKVKSEPDCNMNQLVHALDPSNIICVLGKKPKVGNVFGVSTANIFRTSKPLKHFGTLNYFCAPDKETRASLNTSFSIVYKALKTKGLDFITVAPITYTVKVTPSKSSGMFVFNKLEGQNHTVAINPFNLTPTDMPHCIAHELGHYLLHRMDDEQLMKWVDLYTRYIKPKVYSHDECEELKIAFSSAESIREFKSSLEDPELFNKCISHVKRSCKISGKALDLLFEEQRELFLSLWPESITLTNYESIITEYATKNYEETFCEAFAFYVLDKELPKKVRVMMKNSLARIKIMD